MTNDGTLVVEDDLEIRLFRNEPADIAALTRWFAQPHVRAWWDPDLPAPSYDEVAATYGGCTHPSSPTTPCVIELADRPVGYVQFYRWSSWPDEAREMDIDVDRDTFGLDILIGEADLIGTGTGARSVDLLCRYLAQEHAASGFALATEVTNLRAQRAYEKAGFTREREILDTDTRGGERVRSWLMVRPA